MLGILDEDSALADLLAAGGTRTFTVNLLGEQHRQLADAFAVWRRRRVARSLLADGTTLSGARCCRTQRPGSAPGCQPRPITLVRGTVGYVEIADDPSPRNPCYLRGRHTTVTGR